MTYHDTQTPHEQKLETAMKDAFYLYTHWPKKLKGMEEFSILRRFVNDQIETAEDGSFSKIRDSKELNSRTLPSPAEPEQTFRRKAGKDH